MSKCFVCLIDGFNGFSDWCIACTAWEIVVTKCLHSSAEDHMVSLLSLKYTYLCWCSRSQTFARLKRLAGTVCVFVKHFAKRYRCCSEPWVGEGHSGADQQRQRWQVGGKEREREIVCECERKRRRRAVKTEEVKCRLVHHSFVKDLKQNNTVTVGHLTQSTRFSVS